jgi:hypothetical protein
MYPRSMRSTDYLHQKQYSCRHCTCPTVERGKTPLFRHSVRQAAFEPLPMGLSNCVACVGRCWLVIRKPWWTCQVACLCFLTPWSRVLIERLTGLHLVKKFPAFYGIPMYAWVSPVVPFPQVSPPKPCTRRFPSPSSLHASESHSSRFNHPHNSG